MQAAMQMAQQMQIQANLQQIQMQAMIAQSSNPNSASRVTPPLTGSNQLARATPPS